MKNSRLTTPNSQLTTKLVIILALTIACLLLPQTAQAAEYYVSPTGNDTTGNGAISSPWLTITKGQSMLVPGDTLFVRDGCYHESVTLTKQGTDPNPITIKAYTGETPILDGTEPVTGWQQCQADDVFLTVQGVINPSYASIYKIKIHSSKLPTDLDKFMLFEDGNHSRIARWPDQLLGYGIDVSLFMPVKSEAYGEKTLLLDSTEIVQADDYWAGAWVDVYSHAANAWIIRRTIASNSDHKLFFDTPLAEPISYGSTPDSYSIVNHPHVLDSAGEFAHTMAPDAEGYYTFYLWPKNMDNLAANIKIPSKNSGIIAYNKNYVIIDGFKVVGYTSHGILFYVNTPPYLERITVKNCTVEDCGGSGIYFIHANNSTIEHCKVSRVGDRGAFINCGTNGLIQYCEVRDTTSTNISFYTMTNGRMLNNTLYGCIGAHGNGSSCYINCNKILIAYNYYQKSNLALQNIKNVAVYGNVFDYEEIGTGFVSTWPDNTGGRTDEYQIYLHNTVLGSSNNSALSLRGQTASPFPQNYVINNIIDGCNAWDVKDVSDMSYNLYTGYGWRQESRYGWSLGTGEIDGRSYALNQIFTSPGAANGGDYTLTATSPAVGKGKNVSDLLNTIGVTTWFSDFDFSKDRAGNSWKSTPSIGAYEYGATSSTATGDINGDGSVDAIDLQLLINMILSGSFDSKADLNSDSSVDAVDLQALVNIILG